MSASKQPKDNPLAMGIVKLFLPLYMQLKYGPISLNIADVDAAKLKSLKRKRVVLCPNHPSMLDADVMFALANHLNEQFYFMAAHVLFYGHRMLDAFLLQSIGCYPVIRGAADFDAFRTTRDLLMEGKKKLVIFPEGEVSHDSDELMPLQAGAVQISLAALDGLAENKKTGNVYLVPVAIKYFYTLDISNKLQQAIKNLESTLLAETHENMPIVERLKLLTEILLTKLETEFGCMPDWNSTLKERIYNLRACILERLAAALSVHLPDDGHHLDWVHLLQKSLTDLRENRLRLKEPINESKHAFIRHANKNIRHVLNFISLDCNFPDSSASQEDLAETTQILEQEIFGRYINKGPRVVLMKIGNPINLRPSLALYKENRQEAIQQVRLELKNQLSSILSTLEKKRPSVS